MTTEVEPRAGASPSMGAAAAALIATSPPWLATRRSAAWDAFAALPWPSSMRDEDWRRTDISKLDVGTFAIAADTDESVATASSWLDCIGGLDRDAAVVMCAPSGEIAIRNAQTLLDQGVVISSLHDAVVTHADLVQKALADGPSLAEPIGALWNAQWRGGVFVHVPAGVEAMAPLWIVHIAGGDKTAVFPAVVGVLAGAASVQLTQLHVSSGAGEALSVAATAFHLGRDARLGHCLLQQLNTKTWHLANHRHTLENSANLRFFGATFGSRLQKAYWDARLAGQGAEASLSGIAYGHDRQHLDHQSLQAHGAPDTTSNLLLKTAVTDNARSVYSGLIDVDEAAQRTDGYVQNRNLILSHGAKADSVPRLEIRAHDVKCGHGATAGHIDDEQRFYLMSRGVSAADADRIIVRAFFDDAIAQVPVARFATLLGDILDRTFDEAAG